MTTSPAPGSQLDEADPRSSEQQPRGSRARRRRRIIAATTLLTVVGLLLANAAMVNWQSAPATGDSTLHLDGDDIHVSQAGPRDAPALVLIHGLGASTEWWSPIVPALATSYRVIRIDLLGHGRSAKPTGGGYAIPQQGRRVGQALDQLGIEHAIVIGHSTGGYVATALAEHRSDLVTALALIDTGPRLDAFVSDGPVGKLVFVPVLGQLLWRLRTDGILRRGLSTAFAPGFHVPQQLVDDTRSMTYHALTETSRASDEYLTQRPLPDRLTSLGKPLLVIFGELDQRWRPTSAAQYRSITGTKVELVPGVGHSPMLEDPPHTAGLLLSFISSVPGGQ
ncbi:Pimeloyl-ACP methyl ester carboxylesterase [Micromonospora phaseoli]|uniref:Pimeloyl-ACP methyl ester carboxylesterase n=1 Tax=Micromonospora phaseoli TaxID=1144548 RepID=A0A1H7B8I2_9ACTN|nr:alpha/beta hydrolase [Micromonospora phaseoli]PZV95214.1 pimeloyl-ACP methyl ester carboxylesterase [Micromonospora phaseoli]GIJ79035.1 alpha/beta hydrolase [Micromonospora phaseoli]SEJ72587.1 Pimeloyl-ACP methyl ester carboxylesterase [Micromonospora phaseoli]